MGARGFDHAPFLSEKAATIFLMELSVKSVSILLVLMFILSNLTRL